jgi:hypothetical protein
MKELLQGIWVLIWAIIVTTLVWSIGTIYSLGYSIWLTLTLKKPIAFFKFWLRTIDGFLAAIGHVLHEIAYALDLTWNVNGEIIEDIVTTEENTTFNQKNITVSSSIGRLELDSKLNKSGKKFSKVLNFFFGQKRHAIDSWNYMVAKEKLRNEYFN